MPARLGGGLPVAGERLRSSEASATSGPIVGGRYTLLEAVGSGGGGAVYRAWDRELGLQVALKVLASEWATEIHLKRLKREIRITRDIDHPNVSRVFDLGDSDGTIFLTMRWIDGEPLGRRVQRGGKLDGASLVRLARGLVAALAAAHRLGVVHRDVKPANVLVSPSGEPVLVDFGVATDAGTSPQAQVRRGERITLDGQVPGTPAFMAPEQMRGDTVTAAADLFSLALTIAYAATGRAVVPERPEKVFAPLGRPLGALLARCFALDPVDRPRDATAVEAALARSVRRKRVVWIGSSAIVLTALAVLAAVLAARRATREATVSGPELVWVTPLENRTGDPDLAWLVHGVPDLMEAGLEASGRVHIAMDERARRRASKLTGSIVSSDGAVTVDLLLVGPDGRRRARSSVPDATGPPFFEGIDAAVRRFRTALGVPASRAPPPAKALFVGDLQAFAHYENAQAEIRRHRYVVALEELRRAVEREPGFARAHLQRYVLVATGGHGSNSEAAASLEAAQKRRDALPKRERDLLDALLEAQSGRTRFEPLLAYLRSHPPDGTVYRMASDLLRGARSRRRTVLEEWAARLPEDPEAHNQLAYLYRDAGDEARSEHEFREYLRLAPDEANAHDSYGDFLRGSGRFDEAIRAYDAALGLDPSFSSAAASVVDAMFQADDLAGARARLAHARAVVPPDSRDFESVVTLEAAIELVGGGTRRALRALDEIAARPDIGSRAYIAREYAAIVDGFEGETQTARRAAIEAERFHGLYHGPRAAKEGLRAYVEALAAWRRRDRGALARATAALDAMAQNETGGKLGARRALVAALGDALAGDPGMAAERLLAITSEIGGVWFLAMRERARLLAGAGRLREAHVAYGEALERRRRLASSPEAAHEWRACLGEAASLAREIGESARADALEARLASLTRAPPAR